MPTSNETRVRVEDLVKMSAQVWPASGVPSRPRWQFQMRGGFQQALDFLGAELFDGEEMFHGDER